MARILTLFGKLSILLVLLFTSLISQGQVVKGKTVASKQIDAKTGTKAEPALEKGTAAAHSGGIKQIIPPRAASGNQKTGISWLKTTRNARSLSYIENLGQCDDIAGVPGSDILYTMNDKGIRIFFTKKGLIYQLRSREKVSERDWERYAKANNIKEEDGGETDKDDKNGHYIPHESVVQMHWEGGNPDVRITPENALSDYFNYYNPKKNKEKIIGHARGYQKITYKNIYPNIDIEYTIHEESGIEYACILHPGADPKAIQMVYSGTDLKQDVNNNILLPTNLGVITDHAPETFLGSVATGEKIGSSFSIIGKNTVGFKLSSGEERITQTTIIDPWTKGPPTLVNETTLDIATDPSNNVIVYSSDATYDAYATKFNSLGVKQWTLDLTTNFTYYGGTQGDIGADNSNNVYMSLGLGSAFGHTYNTIKIDPTGAILLWGTHAAGLSTQDLWESWDITFDCNQSQLIQSGGGFYNGTVYYNVSSYGTVNTANGVEGALYEDDALGDIISSFWAPSGLLYHLCSDPNSPATRTGAATSGAHNKLICVDPSSGFSRKYTVTTGYSYADGDAKGGVSTGMNAIASSCTFLYTTDGAFVDKWDLLTGAHYAQTAIPGGSNSLGNVNSGIVCDKCGNVYVGSNGTIEIFDGNLTHFSNITGLPDRVTDMAWSKNGELLACGGTTGSSPFVTSISVATCSLGSSGLTLSVTQATCGVNGSCSATVSFCGAPYSYSWSDGSSTQTVSNLAPGTYTVSVSGSVTCPFSYTDVNTFTINTPPNTVTGSISPTNITCNAACNGSATVTPGGGTGAGTYGFAWTPSGGAAATASALCPNTYTCTITDGNGCTNVQTATITEPTALSSSQTAQTNILCNGNATGAATVSAANGAGGYTYTWSPAPGGGQGTVTATGLSAGANTCTVHDANGCASSQVFTLTQPAAALSSSQSSQTNILCTGNSTGAATVAAANGAGGYSYTWSPAPGGGQGTVTATGLSSGANTCTIHDANGCTTSQVFTLTQPAIALSSSQSSQTNVLCTGNTTGAATVAAANGAGGYSYTWSPAPGGGQGTVTATGLSSGANTCTIHDANGCTTSQVFTLTQPAVALSSSQSSQTNILCTGYSTGAATVAAANGAGGYSYTWSPAPGGGQGTTTATGLSSGANTCTIHDANGCTTSQVFTLTQPATGLSSSQSAQTNVLCTGNTTGAATVSAANGAGGYTYTWSPAPGAGQGTPSATGLSAGANTCTIHDANGCTTSQIFTLTQPAIVLSSSQSAQTNVLCNGNTTGAATVAAANGAGGYSYTWSPAPGGGQGTTTATGLSAGANTCTIHDANGCTTSQIFTLTQPAVVLSSSQVSQTNVLCKGNSTGAATVAAANGAGGFTYTWSPVPGGGQGTTTATGIPAGVAYTCTIHDANGCSTAQAFTLTQPGTVLSIASQSSTLTGCGVSTGTATVSVAGGTGADTYTWAPVPGGGQGTVTATGLTAANYTVTVHDANGCPIAQTYAITTAGGPSASLASSANAKCNVSCDGTATVTASGGTGAGTYTYSWSGGAGTAATASSLCAGTYTCTILDANNCPITQTAVITAPATLAASVGSQTNATCNGSSTGIATVAVAGGTTNYTYAWTGGTIGGGQGTASATGLALGTYTCTVNDAHNCVSSQVFNITQPTLLTASASGSTQTGCGTAIGTATVTPGGGTGADTYTWSGGVIGGGQGTATATGLAAGTYTVTVHDTKNCPASTTYNITSAGGPTASLAASANAKCNTSCDGTASVSVLGGTGAYTYSWSPSGGTAASASGLCANTYTCNITDGNNCVTTQNVTISAPTVLSASSVSQTNVLCNGSATGAATVSASGGAGTYAYAWTGGTITAGQGTATASGLAQGTYTCTVTDANACPASQVFTLSQPVTGLSSTQISQTNVGCMGALTGNATVSATGGTGAYTYAWTGGTITSGQGTVAVSNLASGTYTCSIIDANGCPSSQIFNITQPATGVSSTQVSQTNVLCTGNTTGAATVSASGGTGSYTYSWTGGIIPSGQGTVTASGLSQGTYTCLITDANGCGPTQVFTISQPAANLTSAQVSQTNVDCKGNSSAAATVSASGGTATYTYAWSGGTIGSGQGTATASGLAQGTYTCNITDANGCTAAQTFTLSEPALALTSTVAQTNVNCNGTASGQATVTPNGGTTNYTYSWSTASPNTAATATGLAMGTYTCSISDANNCKATQVVTISQPAALSGIATPVSATCNLANGTASVAPAGGSPSYTYSWSSGGTNPTTSGLAVGNYSCTITDSLACKTIVNFSIANVGSKPVASVNPSGTTSFCQGTSTVFAASGGTSYSWNTGASTNFINVTSPGVYTAYVTNSCGVDSAYGTAVMNPLPNPTITGKDTLCHGDSVLLVASGGNTYLWSTGSTSAAIYVSATGNYTVKATNTCGSTSATMPVFVSSVTADFIPSTTSGSHPLPVTFRDSSSASSIIWAWTFGDGSTGSGQFGNDYTYNSPGTYTVTLTTTNAQHCTSTHSEVIVVSDINSYLTAPNIFTPNDDGVNDNWQVSASGIDLFDAKIYDRWGVPMAQLIAPNEVWDGRTQSGLLASPGTYYYVIHAKGEDGKVFNLTGFIELIRK
jgi:gliding motility-associated-like protein